MKATNSIWNFNKKKITIVVWTSIVQHALSLCRVRWTNDIVSVMSRTMDQRGDDDPIPQTKAQEQQSTAQMAERLWVTLIGLSKLEVIRRGSLTKKKKRRRGSRSFISFMALFYFLSAMLSWRILSSKEVFSIILWVFPILICWFAHRGIAYKGVNDICIYL